MGRPRKPTHLHALTGELKRRPKRFADRQCEPEPDPDIGDPPESMPARLRPLWAEIVDCAEPGVLTRMDRHWLEASCLALWNMRNPDASGLTRGQIVRFFAQCFGKMGLTPVDRGKVARVKR